MRNMLVGTVEVAFLMAAAGCEPVDDGAANRAKGWDNVLTDHVLDHDREVFTNTDETMIVADGCAKTEIDALQILKDNCASCHDEATRATAPAIESCQQGPTATFNFVLNPAKMKAEMWTPAGQQTPMRYLAVGDADASAIFDRAASKRDMPPVQTCPEIPYYERVTFSAASVLRQWIEVCL